jgi:hypothetical protein
MPFSPSRSIKSLCNIVIPNPMNLITAMRQVIRHDVSEAFEDTEFTKDHLEMITKGIVSKECFDVLMNFSTDDHGFSNNEIWYLLIQLKLATEINEPPSLYIPALISDSNEKTLMNRIKSISGDKRSAGFVFSFQKSDSVTGLHSQIMCQLTTKKHYFGMKNLEISFTKGFSMKIENRRIGIVAAMHGFLKWAEDDSMKTVEFVIVEKDVNNVSAESTDMNFARHKV